MARNTVKVGKSETLTIRLDPKTRFILEYLSRLKGQTITTVVERAIIEMATETLFRSNGKDLTWQDLWDVSEGVRSLNIAGHHQFFPTYDEEKRLEFTKKHWPFFYLDYMFNKFDRPYIEVLWPRIDEFIQIHEESRATNYFEAGRQMKKALEAANIEPPVWPPTVGDGPQEIVPF
ncbi:hypothetical protein [Kaistia defluvii]|uniref:Uncharacterized protein n=1 Tax=Kaistia defluvii TaxID=410841 RepID=A0ABV2R157_9HYPH